MALTLRLSALIIKSAFYSLLGPQRSLNQEARPPLIRVSPSGSNDNSNLLGTRTVKPNCREQ